MKLKVAFNCCSVLLVLWHKFFCVNMSIFFTMSFRLFSRCCFSFFHVTISFISCCYLYFYCAIVAFVLFTLLLLFYSRYCYSYSFCIATLFFYVPSTCWPIKMFFSHCCAFVSFVSMVLPLPSLPCAGQSSNTKGVFFPIFLVFEFFHSFCVVFC